MPFGLPSEAWIGVFTFDLRTQDKIPFGRPSQERIGIFTLDLRL